MYCQVLRHSSWIVQFSADSLTVIWLSFACCWPIFWDGTKPRLSPNVMEIMMLQDEISGETEEDAITEITSSNHARSHVPTYRIEFCHTTICNLIMIQSLFLTPWHRALPWPRQILKWRILFPSPDKIKYSKISVGLRCQLVNYSLRFYERGDKCEMFIAEKHAVATWNKYSNARLFTLLYWWPCLNKL